MHPSLSLPSSRDGFPETLVWLALTIFRLSHARHTCIDLRPLISGICMRAASSVGRRIKMAKEIVDFLSGQGGRVAM